MQRNALIVAVVLPLAAIGLGIVRAEVQLASGRRWVFDVQGYDPRDLLRGHYIAYRLRLDDDDDARSARCNDNDADCCLCLTATVPDSPPRIGRDRCNEARTRCDGILQTRYLADLNRYYVPERDAARLEQRLRLAAAKRQARLRIAIDPAGKPQVESLLVDGERIDKAR